MPRLLRLGGALLLGLVLGTPAPAGEPALPDDLALVPPDATGFVHVRVADIWKSDLLAEYRTTLQKAGTKVLAAFDRRFLSLPSSLDRVTGFVTVTGGRPSAMAVIVTATKPLDQPALLRQLFPNAVEEGAGRTQCWKDPGSQTEFYFPTARSIALGPPGTVAQLRKKRAGGDGPLSKSIELARRTPVVVAVNAGALPPQAFREVPPDLQPLTRAELVTLSVDPVKAGAVELRLTYADADQAGEADAAARKGLKMARGALAGGRREMEQKALAGGRPGTFEELPEAAGALFALGMLNRLDEYLAAVPWEKDDTTLRLALKIPEASPGAVTTAAVGVALLVPAVQKVRGAAARMQSQNNLKQIALAMHNYHDTYKKLPAAAICDKQGRPLLSWRVAILPYIEQDALYRQFKLDEPWDSEHNRPLLARMPPIYVVPTAPERPGETYYRVFVGGGAGFETCKGLWLPSITDGTSNTLMAVEAAESVPWTKPDELTYNPKGAVPRLGQFFGNVTNVAFFDGSVRAIMSTLPEETLRALITRAGNEVLNDF